MKKFFDEKIRQGQKFIKEKNSLTRKIHEQEKFKQKSKTQKILSETKNHQARKIRQRQKSINKNNLSKNKNNLSKNKNNL